NISGVTLAPLASKTYSSSYTLTEADLDKKGNSGGVGSIHNTATADSNETASVSDSAEVPLTYNPALAIDKVFVNVTGGNGNAASSEDRRVGNERRTGANTGNVTQTDVTVVDPRTAKNIRGD